METLEYLQVPTKSEHPTFVVKWGDKEFNVSIEDNRTLKQVLEEHLGMEIKLKPMRPYDEKS